ncbi:MAG: hypothetical protein BM557_01220 [Flavobacterium sp. MedPE-SWcel]|mgnify:CR=1 FL=1|uniref:hypothetical protein n=1 Tax=uncultured Flavobacterium sp. TaxID=165435 RepID=UPI00091E5AEE|nr:hypothetical protein [uncultured Flavobacterium sp.]OIQ22028.1 MAG: hypothetical protein BM557_01220 [Flavobacterium sp. MedPE-SWcel]
MRIATTQAQVFTIGGFAPIISPDGEIILKLTTRGTCFPARADGYSTRSCFFQVRSFNNIANSVLIDYSDGTGWHEYNLVQNGSRTERIFRVNDSDDPTTITPSSSDIYVSPNDGLGGGEFGIHFYQDLQDPAKIDTVDHYYNQEREIFIKFQTPSKIQAISFQNVVLLGTFPSLARLRNLVILELEYLPLLSAFENEAVNTFLKIVSLSFIGSTATSVPIWIKNSPITYLNLSSYITLSDANHLENEIITPFKTTLNILSLNKCNLNYQLPESFGEIVNLNTFSCRSMPASENFKFPTDLSNLTDFKSLNISDSNNFPFSEVKRYIQDVPSTGKYLNIRNFGSTVTQVDFALDTDDYSVESFDASYGRWNNGTPPTCIGQMKALETLVMYGSYNYSVYSGRFNLLNWGDFSSATALREINFRWQQKMDLTFPTWLVNLTNLKIFDCHASFETQEKMDQFVDSVYDFITTNASITEGNSPFRIMHIKTYRSASPLNSFHPTGIYQEPTEYVQGSANGTPTTPLEKVWVLTHQYQHTWVLKP